ncbi:MAG: hypothetical protein PHC88_11895 [Terrimicrobiaceae bacterium]|nr:hypothetical protein [Terrimicrobiaceae bacterium]
MNQRNLPKPVTTNVAFVSAAYAATLFVKTDGTLWATGLNYSGQFGNGTRGNYYVVPKMVATDIASVSTASSHTLFIKTDRTLWAVGDNFYGELGDSTTMTRTTPEPVATNVASVSTGLYHTLFIKTDGTLWATGNNQSGNLGDGTATKRITPVPIATNVATVSTGRSHTLFVTTDGTLWATGYNFYGQLGDGTTKSRTVPEPVATNVASVAAGDDYTLFIKKDGTLWATGSNRSGQLGNGTTTNCTTPVPVATDVAFVIAGDNHTLFVKTDGTLWATGKNDAGQLGIGTNTNHTTPVLVTTGLLLNTLSRIAVTPNDTIAFPALQIGKTADQAISVTNASKGTVVGSANVSAPFSVVSGGAYSLGPGQSQNVTLRYAPTVAEKSVGFITFSDGQNILTRQVTGSAFTDPTALTGTLTGRVIDAQTGDPISGVKVSVSSKSNADFGASGIAALSSANTEQLGTYKVSGIRPNTTYQVFAQDSAERYAPMSFAANSTTPGAEVNKNISLKKLALVPPSSDDLPVVLVRGAGKNTDWLIPDDPLHGEYTYWEDMTLNLKRSGFKDKYIWNCNEPDTDKDFPVHGHVIIGEFTIASRSYPKTPLRRRRAQAR